MTDFLVNSLSKERWSTYQALEGIKSEPAAELYSRNLTYSKELYVILAGLEVIIRNSFHESLRRHYKKEDWMSSLNLFRQMHKQQLEKAIGKLTDNKTGKYSIPDLIAELNFGFWAHLLDAPYEQKLWIPCLRFSFPNKFGKPVRQDVESRLKNLVRLRNKIAHLEPIIKNEEQLMQAYQNCLDIISWICPKTANWFDNNNGFKELWNKHNKLA